MTPRRYTVLEHEEHTSEGSDFAWYVIDETRPKPKFGHNPVCSCIEETDARRIAELLERANL